jgi:hypothetical protein
LGLVPRRYQSGEIDYVGSISKCGDRRVRTLLYEAANVMLTRYKGQLKLKDWAFAIAKRSTMRKARVALARRLGIIMHAMLRDETEFVGERVHVEFGLAEQHRPCLGDGERGARDGEIDVRQLLLRANPDVAVADDFGHRVSDPIPFSCSSVLVWLRP